MKKSDFVFNSVDALYYRIHKISLNRACSYIDSPEWLKNKKATINPKNKKDNKCFQYAIATALNYQQINNHPEEIYNIKSFISKYNWKDINFPSSKEDWNYFEKNNKSIAFNVLFVPHITKQIRPAYISKHIFDRENQVILLMVADSKKWHYLAVKKLSALLRGITSKHDGDFYCLNCFYIFRTKNSLKKHKNVFKDHDYCYLEMPDKDNNISKYNPGEKSMNVPFIINSDSEPLLEKMNTCHNDPEKLSTTKINKGMASGCSLYTYFLIIQKISLIIIEVRIVRKSFARH